MRAVMTAGALGALVGAVLAGSVLLADAQNQTSAIGIDNFTFNPQTVTVKAGTTVTWTNKDDIPHGIAATNTPSSDRQRSTPTTAFRSRSPRRAPTSTSATFTRI